MSAQTQIAPAPVAPTVVRRPRRTRRRRLTRAAWNLVGILVLVVLAFPVFWMVSTAFKPDDQINSLNPSWFSLHPTLAHFTDAVHRPFFWADVKNSLIIVGVTVALSMALAFLAAVALAKFRFTGQKLFIVLLLGIPRELEEAAMVDGSSRLGAFVKILLPLVAPGLVATSIFAFITSWNEYIFARILLNDQAKQTATVWLSYLYGTSRHTDWGALMAGSTLLAVPVVVFFLIVQRKIAFGLTAGAVKA